MKVVGLVTEYNPFHNGHKYHIEKAKEITGADYVVAIMSGNFVQRGVPAVTDKYTRTKMALSGGCDLVLELPVRYATASAENFALGAVAGLTAASRIDCICFGSECGNIDILDKLGLLYSAEPQQFKGSLAGYVREGFSYPVARGKATMEYYGDHAYNGLEEILKSPNNILGMEYCKAIHQMNSRMEPYTILRKGAGYHNNEVSECASASGIRTMYRKMESLEILENSMPKECMGIVKQIEKNKFPVDENDLSEMLYYAILRNRDHLEEFTDVSTEIADRIRRNLVYFTVWEDFAQLIKTKQYTMTRINRCLLHILLGMRIKKRISASKVNEIIPYLRVLGLNERASGILKEIKKDAQIPVITKLSEGEKKLMESGSEMLKEDVFAAHLYNRVLYSKFGTSCVNEYQEGIVIC